jgi:two-component system response regulator PilR (NtrC family)
LSGLDLLKAVKAVSPSSVVLMMTAFASTETAVEAMREGAYDYLTKPFKIDEVKLLVKNALERKQLQDENTRLKQVVQERASFEQIVGRSEKLNKVLDLIRKVADANSNVLIFGESGTGKELVAKAVHAASGRADAPFVAINCGNIPAELLESEMFGHVRGAYTGATAAKKGLFEMADGGSLFLDEIAAIPMEIQAKLLRVIQEREFRRLGGVESIRVDVRIIAATNTDLLGAVSRGTFRDDLYYRLNVIVIKLPPLRERTEDIPLLGEHFIRKYCAENAREPAILDPAALRVLMDYRWPGNVRELENVIERAVVLSTGKILTAEMFPRNVTVAVPQATVELPGNGIRLKERVMYFERALIVAALEKTDWNQKKAAQLLSVNPTTLSEKLKRLKIKVDD